MRALAFVLAGLLAVTSGVAQTTYYVRSDGGTPEQCTGRADAAYSGSGSGQACAWRHPFHALPPGGTPRLSGGDTLIIAAGSYMMGYGAPGADACEAIMAWDCRMPRLPSGPDASHPTRILGAAYASGCATRPELWGTERADFIVDLTGTSNAVVACLEITDHSGCVESHSGSISCQRDTSPFGTWAATGLVASDSRNVRLADLDIHGLGNCGIRAGRLTDWTVERVRVAGNGWVGWDGDIDGEDSNSGTLTFRNFTVEWNGCGETYPGEQPSGCWAQSAGGYGDGFGTGATAGTWVFEDSKFLYNTSDGLDLLYARSGSSITIRRVHAEGNAGNQLKTNGPVTIENSIAVGNCGFFEGKSFTLQVDPCRALGNTLSLTLRQGAKATVTNNTIAGEGDVLLLADCDSEHSSCNGAERVVARNNIFIGATEFLSPDDLPALSYQETFSQGNAVFDIDYSLVRNVKNNDCPGTHHTCGQATKITSEAIDSFDAHLLAGSPAINAGTSVGAPTVDFDNQPRDATPDIGAYEYRASGSCTVTCSATVAATAVVGQAVTMTGQATTSGCTGAPTYDWDFGDGTTHATTASTTHTYATEGAKTWRFTASVGGTTCQRSGSITVSTQSSSTYQYLVPSVAHAPGAAGTNWRSDVAVVNDGSGSASLSLSFVDYTTGVVTPVSRSLAAGATQEWLDVLVSVFARPATTSVKGTLRIGSSQPLVISSRTYNQETATRTYGQYYPALITTDGVATGQRGLLPQLKKSSAFRTNIGFANGGSSSCSVRYQLHDPSGSHVGSSRSLTVGAGTWTQEDDVFTKTGAGNRDIAYAVVEVDTAGCRVWAYASVIDQATGDPTTVPVTVR